MVRWKRSGRKSSSGGAETEKKTGDEGHKPDEPVRPTSTGRTSSSKEGSRGLLRWGKKKIKKLAGVEDPTTQQREPAESVMTDLGWRRDTQGNTPSEPPEIETKPASDETESEWRSSTKTKPPSGGTGELSGKAPPAKPHFIDIVNREMASLYGSCSNYYTVTMMEIAGENSKFNAQVIWSHHSGNIDDEGPTGLREALNRHYQKFDGMPPPVIYIILGRSVNDAVRGVVSEGTFIPEEWDYGEEERVLLKCLIGYSRKQSEDELIALLEDIGERESAFQQYIARKGIGDDIIDFLQSISEGESDPLEFMQNQGDPLDHPITNPDLIPQINFIGPMDLEKMFGITERPPDGMIFIVCRPNLHDKKREEELKKLAQVTVRINGQEERTVYWYEDVPVFTVGSSLFDNIIVPDFSVLDSILDGILFLSEMPYKPLLFSLKFDEMADPFDSNPGASFPDDPRKISYSFSLKQKKYSIKSAYDPNDKQAFFVISREAPDGESTKLLSLTFDFTSQARVDEPPPPGDDTTITEKDIFVTGPDDTGAIDSGTIGEAIEIITNRFDQQTDEEKLIDLRVRKATLTLEYRAIGDNIHDKYGNVTGYFGRSCEARARMLPAETAWRVGQREYVLPSSRGAGSDWVTRSKARIVVELESEQSPIIRASGDHTIYVCRGDDTTPDVELRPNETLPTHYLSQRFTLHEPGLTGDPDHHLDADWFMLGYRPVKNVFYAVRADNRKITRKIYGLLDIEPDLCIGLNEGWNIGGRLSEADDEIFREFHLFDLNGFPVPGEEGFRIAYLQMAMSRFQLLIHDDGTLVNISTSGKPIFVLNENFEKKMVLLPIMKGDFFQDIKIAQGDRQRLDTYRRSLQNIDAFVERAVEQNSGQDTIRTQLESGDLVVAGHAVLRYRRPTPVVSKPSSIAQTSVQPESVPSEPDISVEPDQPKQPQPVTGTMAGRSFATIGWTLSADNFSPRTLKRDGDGIALTEPAADENPLFTKRPHEIKSFAESGISGIIRRPRNDDRFSWEDRRGGLIIELRTDELGIKHQIRSDAEKWELYQATDAEGSVNIFALCEAGAKWLGAGDAVWMNLAKPLARIPSGEGTLWLGGSGRCITFSG